MFTAFHQHVEGQEVEVLLFQLEKLFFRELKIL